MNNDVFRKYFYKYSFSKFSTNVSTSLLVIHSLDKQGMYYMIVWKGHTHLIMLWLYYGSCVLLEESATCQE
jgi:hypothetical protein